MNTKLNNTEYEEVVLGMLLLDNTIIDIIKGKLVPECFCDMKARTVYNTILSQWESNHYVDIVTLISELSAMDKTYIISLTDKVTSAVNWEIYVSKLRELYLARTFKAELNTTLNNISPDTINENIASLETKLTSFMQYGGKDGAEVKNLCVEIPEEMQRAMNEKKKFLGFETGFEELDTILDGWQTGQLYVVGARPSIGKTAFSLSLLRALCSHGVSATLFSLEMSAKQCFYRMLSSEANLPMWQLKKGTCLEYKNGVTKLRIGLNKLFEYKMNILDMGANTDEDIYSRIRYEAVVKGKKVFVIDHLGLIQIAKPSAQHYLDVGRITSRLHALAKELNVCIIILCQMSRAAEGNKPSMNLIRESGNIEQDADVIMFLHRERESNEINIPTDVIVEKNRDGRIGTVHFIFNTENQSFREDKQSDNEIGYAPIMPAKTREDYEESLPF